MSTDLSLFDLTLKVLKKAEDVVLNSKVSELSYQLDGVIPFKIVGKIIDAVSRNIFMPANFSSKGFFDLFKPVMKWG
jgi:hypothetical protein